MEIEKLAEEITDEVYKQTADLSDSDYVGTMKCPITNKEGYVKEEDCHCFCCGIHRPERSVSTETEVTHG